MKKYQRKKLIDKLKDKVYDYCYEYAMTDNKMKELFCKIMMKYYKFRISLLERSK